MAECTGKDLQTSRIRAKLVQWQLANACGVSESEIGRWERDEALPQPDDVDRYAIACRDDELWDRWMISHYDSCRRRYVRKRADNGLAAKMARVRFEFSDVLNRHGDAERDGLDGKINDPALRDGYIKDLQEAIAAGQAVLEDVLNDEPTKGATS